MDHKSDHIDHKDALISMLRQCEEFGAFPASLIDHARYLLARDLARAEDVILPMRARVSRCRLCAHGRRPGLSGGYCVHRHDLPLAYGHLRELPADRGAWCPEFVDQDAQGTGTRPAVAGHSSPGLALVTRGSVTKGASHAG